MVLEEVEPAAGGLQVGVATVIVPGGVGGEGETEVGSFAQGVLGGVGSANTDVELTRAVAGGDDHGATDEGAEGLENFAAELLEHGDELRGNAVVDVVLLCGGRAFELGEHEMLG